MSGERSGSSGRAVLSSVLCPLISGTLVLLLAAGCGYSTHAALPANLKTIYIQPFENKISLASMPTRDNRFPLYRHRMEVDLTNEIINRFQFTGLLRPATPQHADARLEGELISFRRDALRYNSSKTVEEWRLNVVVNLRLYDQKSQTLLWEEQNFTGDTTYFTTGPNAESEDAGLGRAITDLAKRIVERTVENW